MVLIRKVYDRFCELSDKSMPNFSKEHFGSVLHYWLKKTAYFAAKYDNNSEHPDVYWNAAKAFFALNFTGKVDMPWPWDNYSNPSFKPDKLKIKNIRNLDVEDEEIIKLGLKFSGCKVDCPVHPNWFKSIEEDIFPASA